MGLGNPDHPVGGLAVATPAGVELRPLARDDFEVALRLVRELYGLPDTDPEPHRARYDAMLRDADATPFLALADGEPAGLILLWFRRRLNHATYEGWVSDFYVRPAARRRGIGGALLQAAIAEWRLRGGHRVMLEVGYQRPEARALYQRAGFAEAGKYFETVPLRARGLPLDPDAQLRPIRDDEHDFEAVTRLLAELGRPAPSEERLAALRRTYDDHVRRRNTASLVAELAGEAVGCCSLELREPFFATAALAWIPDLIVTERARGRGIGAAMLDAAFAEAQRRGAYGAVLESGFQRTAAHELYRGAGMRDAGSFYTLDR